MWYIFFDYAGYGALAKIDYKFYTATTYQGHHYDEILQIGIDNY